MRFGEVSPHLLPMVRLVIRGPQGRERAVDALLDTGFQMYLALLEPLVRNLGLGYKRDRDVRLANGEFAETAEYEARGLWDGIERPVRALAKPGGLPLVGAAMFHGYRVCIEFVDGGDVTTTEVV